MNIFYMDQHIHSKCSPDGEDSMLDMALAARDHGIKALCFTDHVDLEELKGWGNQWGSSWERIRESGLALMAEAPEGIELHLGIELGEPHQVPEAAREVASAPELDFVLGSLHRMRGMDDFYYIDYVSEEQCRELNLRYLAELQELAQQPCFDVMAHIGYTIRYMRKKGFLADINAHDHREELTGIFRSLIEKGQGIEVNTSGLRAGGPSYPNVGVLQLYRELGGEIITVGSDAHEVGDAGLGVREGYELLQSIGFRYTAQYVKRKPRFIPIQ